MKRSHRKKGLHAVNNTTKLPLNTNVTIDHNPSYDVTKVNTVHMAWTVLMTQLIQEVKMFLYYY